MREVSEAPLERAAGERVNALGLESAATRLRNPKEVNLAGAQKQGQGVEDEVRGVALCKEPDFCSV